MEVSDLLFEVVIPNWNGKDLLAECLCSLRKQSFQNFRVIVVDNGSTDGSVELLLKEFPEVHCIANAENTGFSAAVNAGIKASSTPWVLLLNNDMEVAQNCFASLAEAIETYTCYDFFALKMVNYNQRDYLDGAGEAVLRGGAGYRLGTMEKDQAEYRQDRDCFGACGGAVLYRRDFFENVGLFDEDFFAYLEDVDLNLRAARLAKRCRYLASAVVYHIGSATTGSKFNQTTIRLSTRNSFFVLAKNYSIKLFLRFFFPICIYQFMWLCFCCKKRMLRPYLSGISEACRQLPKALTKGRIFRKNLQYKVISESDFASRILEAEHEAIHSIMNRRKQLGKENTLLRIYLLLFG